MEFWMLAIKYGWVTKEELKQLVVTKEKPNNELTPEEYLKLTGEEFII